MVNFQWHFLLLHVVVTVMFGRPAYTFTEDGVVGSIEVIKDGASDSPLSICVNGGKCVNGYSKIMIVCMFF